MNNEKLSKMYSHLMYDKRSDTILSLVCDWIFCKVFVKAKGKFSSFFSEVLYD